MKLIISDVLSKQVQHKDAVNLRWTLKTTNKEEEPLGPAAKAQ